MPPLNSIKHRQAKTWYTDDPKKKTPYRRLNTTFGVLRSDFGAQTPHHVFGCLGTSNWTPWNPRLILGSLEIPLIPNLYHWFRAPSLPVFFGRESSLPFIQPFLVGGWTTQLKNMRKSNWIISPGVGVKKKYLKPPSTGSRFPFQEGEKETATWNTPKSYCKNQGFWGTSRALCLHTQWRPLLYWAALETVGSSPGAIRASACKKFLETHADGFPYRESIGDFLFAVSKKTEL